MSRGHRSPRRPPSLTHLLFLASTAAALSLANFQVITSSSIPISCIVVYNSAIDGCTSDDFTNSNQCSSSCVNGLLKKQSTIVQVCGDLNVNTQSLLGLTLDGKLVQSLCPGATYSKTTTTLTVKPSTTSQDITTPSRSRTTRTSISTSTSTSTSTINDSPTTDGQTSTSLEISLQTSETSIPTRSAATPQPTTIPTEAGSQAPNAPSVTGGGSPFDSIITGQASSTRLMGTAEVLMLSIGIGLILLW